MSGAVFKFRFNQLIVDYFPDPFVLVVKLCYDSIKLILLFNDSKLGNRLHITNMASHDNKYIVEKNQLLSSTTVELF